MEHLRLPDNVEPFITVPYYAPDEHDWYDGKGHEGYPKRMGWTEQQLLGQVPIPPGEKGSPFGTDAKGNLRKNLDIERFFQTWLYFGTVTEFLNAGHAPGLELVTTGGFVFPKGAGGVRIVTTRYLPISLGRWSESTVDTEKLWTVTTAILNRTLRYLNHFCQEQGGKHPSDHSPAVSWPVRDEISTSIIALVFTLFQAAQHKCDKSGPLPTPILARSKILCERIEKKWCLADATRFEDDMEIDGQYFLAVSPGLPQDELDKHVKCIRDRCLYDFDEKQYVTKHAPAPWHHAGCEKASWGGTFRNLLVAAKGPQGDDWVGQLKMTLEENSIPIVMWYETKKKFYTIEYSKDTGSKLTPAYIAISHVWADGKGNPYDNSLPSCQLANIQDMCNKVRYKGRKPAVSAPYSDGIGFWMDTLCVPVADKTLKTKAIADMCFIYSKSKAVLILDEWLRQIPSTAPAPVMLARTYQSNWIKRLWTHQEGFFPPELWVQFSDCSVEMQSITDKAREYEKSMIPKGIYLNFPSIITKSMSDQYGAIGFFYKDISKNKENIWKLYLPLADIMRMRRTTRQADETVCLATILGLDVISYQNVKDEDEDTTAEKRMEKFLRDLKTFQTGLVFNNWERLKRPGLGWAPKTLLAHRAGPADSEFGYLQDHDGTGEILFDDNGQPTGLPVEYPGFSSFDFSKSTRLSIRCADRAFAIQCQQGNLYMVQLFPNDIFWPADMKLAVILSKPPEKADEDGVLAVIGKAATGDNESGSQGYCAFKHFALARVRLLRTKKPEWIDVVTAKLLPTKSKWLVS